MVVENNREIVFGTNTVMCSCPWFVGVASWTTWIGVRSSKHVWVALFGFNSLHCACMADGPLGLFPVILWALLPTDGGNYLCAPAVLPGSPLQILIFLREFPCIFCARSSSLSLLALHNGPIPSPNFKGFFSFLSILVEDVTCLHVVSIWIWSDYFF